MKGKLTSLSVFLGEKSQQSLCSKEDFVEKITFRELSGPCQPCDLTWQEGVSGPRDASDKAWSWKWGDGTEGTERICWEGGEEQKLGWEYSSGLQRMWGAVWSERMVKQSCSTRLVLEQGASGDMILLQKDANISGRAGEARGKFRKWSSRIR